MSISRLTGAVLVLLLVASPAAGRPGPPEEVSCSACIVVDESGDALWARAAHEPLPNASTTKMVTALVVVRRAELADEVTVSTEAAGTGGGGLDLIAGDRYSVADLLQALLMTSSNDAAAALAEHVSGSQEAFVAEMNELLVSMGGSDSTFVTPHGLDTRGHAASAADLALVGAELLEEPVLARIVAQRSATIAGSRGPQTLENTNLLLEGYSGALGIKTGSTALAGEVLVGAAERGQETIVAVAMHAVDAVDDVARLLDFGFARAAAEVRRIDIPAAPSVDVAEDAVFDALETVFQRVLDGEESLAA